MSDPKDEYHSSGLVKRLGLFAAISLVIGAVIGSGIFKKIAPMSDELMSPGLVLLAWFVAGIMSLFGSLANAELAGLIAEPGGPYAYFRRIFGNLFGYLYGWTCFSVIQSATIASVAYVFAQSLNTLVDLPRFSPDIEQMKVLFIFDPFNNIGVKLVTVGLIVVLTFVNYRGVQYGGFITKVFASAVIIGMVFIVATALFSGKGDWNHLQTNNQLFESRHPTSGSLFTAFFTAMLSAFWAYEGWNNLSFISGEVKNPHKNVPLGLVIGVSIVMTVYMAVNLIFIYIYPVEEFAALTQNENTIAGVAVAQKVLGVAGSIIVACIIMIATFGTTNNTILGASRIYFAMAYDNLFFKSIGKVHPKFRTPGNSLILQGIWASVLVFSGSFDQLTDMLIFAAFIFYGSMALGVFVVRMKMKMTVKTKWSGYPIVPAIFILFCIVLVVNSLLERPRECLIGLFLILAGLPFYFYFRKEERVEDNVLDKIE
jgi:basic amino acid/polyamine antiporter, APA family